jgi:predicted short-subunit dehydrogenase-like oxidoreductase (DUF2520 family)
VFLVRLGNLVLMAALVLAALAATQQISLDGALTGWVSLTAKLATVVS